MPRVELNAALLLADLISRVQSTLQITDIPIYCWSDSTIVLAWIKTCPSKLTKYVANRVWKIREEIPKVEWCHVPTECNPADVASRGTSPNELRTHALWWSGPSWLKNSPQTWPHSSDLHTNQCLPEIKTHALTTQIVNQTNVAETIAARFSSWPKLLRVTALIKRKAYFVTQRRTTLDHEIEPIKSFCFFINQASNLWLKHIQSELFGKEINCLRKQQKLPSGKLNSLDPFLDKEGLLRVGGRLENAPLPFLTKHSIILGPHNLTKLIIHSIHQATLHGGLRIMLRVLREKFCIFQVRNQVRACVHQCVICTRHRAAPCIQKMGNLPSDRINPARPFAKTGVDYCGPFMVRAVKGRGRTTNKTYIAVFVCLVTKAIHLELVSDLSTETFLAALHRFVSRYGLPATVMSDNGTTFQKVDRELRETLAKLRKNANVALWFVSEGIDWHFIPPHAPNFGGIWEVGVKSVKHHLKRVINNQILTFEEMCTLLAQIGARLNSRPISPMSDHNEYFSYLTPAHFLGSEPILSVHESDMSDENVNHLSRWRRVQQMRDQFWRVWRSDYMLQLQTRRKWQEDCSNLSVGDIVLLRSDGLPPCKWELGRIIKCFPGKDNRVRMVTIKTANSTFNRSVNKVCLLPVRCAESST